MEVTGQGGGARGCRGDEGHPLLESPLGWRHHAPDWAPPCPKGRPSKALRIPHSQSNASTRSALIRAFGGANADFCPQRAERTCYRSSGKLGANSWRAT